jgi:hypothetical protein
MPGSAVRQSAVYTTLQRIAEWLMYFHRRQEQLFFLYDQNLPYA